ncbi:hypothetical protein HB364_18740 [Pseudoflavitalea sp. X16]|uniref:hypothetical protein n=1 Tax=Paraflavitalea devenefica TaxID=2716334 RepID=UPI0014204840|nr:hypothetical protein [Paraflavitalea devenefica]NII27132.1 hypothetical protein [Paraflavitalea devenefica]
MNQAFDFNRWGLLVRKHWGDNRNKYTLSLIAVASLLLLWYGFLLLVDGRGPMEREGQIVTYYVGLFLTGSLYASLLFGDLANKPKAINFLSVPASHLEKVLCMALYCVLIYFVCYTVIFYAVDFIMLKVYNAVQLAKWEKAPFLHAPGSVFKPETIANVFYMFDEHPHPGSNPLNMLSFILLLFFGVQGAYALGSIYFPAYSFIKTTITLLLLILFFIFLCAKVLSPILPEGGFSGSLTEFNLLGPRQEWGWRVIQLPSWTDDVFFGFFKFVLAPVFWLATYFRLKEKEV